LALTKNLKGILNKSFSSLKKIDFFTNKKFMVKSEKFVLALEAMICFAKFLSQLGAKTSQLF